MKPFQRSSVPTVEAIMLKEKYQGSSPKQARNRRCIDTFYGRYGWKITPYIELDHHADFH
jgi:hypothetical protein